MLSYYPAIIVGIGLILSGIGCFISLYNNNIISVLIYIGLIMITVGIVWDVYITEPIVNP